MRAVSILSIALACACSSASEERSQLETSEIPAEPAALATESQSESALGPRPLAPRPSFDDARSAWTGDWATTSRVTHSTCTQWPQNSGEGTTSVIRHNESVFQVKRINGWSAYGVASDEPELTLHESWTEPDGAPVALTLKLRFESDERFVMTTEVVVAPWSQQPEGCEIYLEEVGVRKLANEGLP